MPDFSYEFAHHPARVCGVDEAGRGPWAGPVVAAAVYFADHHAIPNGLNDSKQVKPAQRDALFDAICATAIYGVGIATAEEIDRLNIWGATSLAMRRAVAGLSVPPELALIDGKLVPKDFPCRGLAIVKGDSLSLSIAAASILAKVTRDRMMDAFAEEFPGYGFERHKGYGTAQHQQALQRQGVSRIHRRSFAPIRVLLEQAA